MDILDTFGDWMQLVGFAILCYAIINFVFGAFQTSSNIILFGFLVIITYILWVNVYDYDIVLGYILGAVLTLLNSVGHINKINTYGTWKGFSEYSGKKGFVWAVYSSISVIGVMVAKIVLFW